MHADSLKTRFKEERVATEPPARNSTGASRAESFAVRHPFLVHGGIVLLCWGTYALDRADVIWRFIRSAANARALEHAGFLFAALLIGCGAWLGAWPNGNQARWAAGDARSIRRRSAGEILHAAGIAALLPLAGALALIAAETMRSTRFARAKMNQIRAGTAGARLEPNAGSPLAGEYFIRHIAGICAFFSMLVFGISLRDRLADALFATTAMVFIVTRFVDAP
jgi:hypothetical protein